MGRGREGEMNVRLKSSCCSLAGSREERRETDRCSVGGKKCAGRGEKPWHLAAGALSRAMAAKRADQMGYGSAWVLFLSLLLPSVVFLSPCCTPQDAVRCS